MALYAFDGTWNREDKRDEEDNPLETNVRKFWEAYTEPKYYYRGVGTRFGKVGAVLGGAFGAGAKHRLRKAYKDLAMEFAAGHTRIDIVGFSRGAAMALQFANIIKWNGVPDWNTRSRWRLAARKEGLGAGFGRYYARYIADPSPQIRFLGIWDVVGAFGLAKNIGPFKFQEIDLGWDLTLAGNVERCFHGLSLDELRETFRPTRVEGAHEVWFRGVHSNVGGGYADRGLSDIALDWMFTKAEGQGIPVDRNNTEALAMNIDGTLGKPTDPKKDPPRELKPGDLIHSTARQRTVEVNRQIPDFVVVEGAAAAPA